ncbi:MAG: YiiX/YebB-like N1pC/P60 family cysteine hydrolase [Cycloclasticus sp.]
MRSIINIDELSTGDIVLFSGVDAYSKLVKVGTNSRWSHVGLIVESSAHDFLTMWESSIREDTIDVETNLHREGVRLVSFQDRARDFEGDISIRKLQGDVLSEQNIDCLMQLMDELRGREYERNKFELIKAANERAFRNKEEDLSSLFCSELVAESYQRLGLLTEEKPSNDYAPVDFSHDRMQSLGGAFYLSEEI